MPINRKLSELLLCSKCKGSLQIIDNDRALLCASCQLKFPIRDGVPMMQISDANLMPSQTKGADLVVSPAFFKVISGSDRDMSFFVESGTCRALGRTMSNDEKTAVFAIDLALSLDSNTKRLIINYVNQQFKRVRRRSSEDAGKEDDGFGGFKRSTDVILSDLNLSRLHAMLFYDGSRVGILDLVSKNGTFVNGQEVESHIIEIGDVLEMGETKIIRERR